MHVFTRSAVASLLIAILPGQIVYAQLTDVTQTTPTVPGGQIGKSLAEQIGTGHGDEFTPGSAIYLIKRDPARSIRRGRQLFQRKFTLAQGQGPRVSPTSMGDIVQDPKLGAGLADSCAACHGRPRGAAGFGGDVATRPDSRDAPHLFGLGLVEQLADEMTSELRAIQAEALDKASRIRRPVVGRLRSKGVNFGTIKAYPNGSLDTAGVEGVDEDLRVRPFFADGTTMSIREFIVGAFKAEMGLETVDPILCAATDPSNPVATVSPAGMVFDPATDSIERPPVCDVRDDADADGVANEIDTAVVDHLEFYLLNYFKPGTYRETARTRDGQRLLKQIGCTDCHVQNLKIRRDRRVADVETVYDPDNGIFNNLFATASTRFEVVEDDDRYPQLLPEGEPFLVENIFSDLKRHDLGPNFHERKYDGTLATDFVTEPLWGAGSTSPYGHDGRSVNLREVILRHGGEAQRSRNRFAGLNENRQQKIIEFLETLVLFPPDDTASNLNPGNPYTVNPQDPAQHGSINLGALFQIPGEGAE